MKKKEKNRIAEINKIYANRFKEWPEEREPYEQIASKDVVVKRALRGAGGGDIRSFTVDGITTAKPSRYSKANGIEEEYQFDDTIIDEVVKGNEDRLDRDKDKRYKMYLELKKEFE
jgi:hypothetical protein